MFIINLPPQPVPHLLPLFNELPLVALNKISTLREFQQHWTEGGRREAEGAGDEGEGEENRVPAQGDSDGDSSNAGSAAASAPRRTTWQHVAPGLIAPEQGTNNLSDLGWPVLPCAALCLVKFDLSQAVSHLLV